MSNELERISAVKILLRISQHKGSLSALLTNTNSGPDSQNNALIQEFSYGVCRHYYQLEYIYSSLITKPLRNKDNDIKFLILIGLYQLFFMRTPSHAAINETVNTLKKLKKDWAKALVNAILRNAQRQHPTLLNSIDNNYCYKYSHPDWLISALKKSWPKQYLPILQANNERAPMTLRVNLAHTSRDNYLLSLTNTDIPAKPGTLSNTAVLLEQPVPVQAIPGFASGVVSVQDEASQLCASLLQLKPGQRVLDACAAPGGKSCAILEHEPSLDELVAIDCEQRRLNKVDENLQRIGLQATLLCADVANLDAWWDGKLFDRILLDVPCSATGVIRRHPDIKLLRKKDDIAQLVSKQKTILNAAWSLLKPKGILLYSTCSLLLEENSHQVSDFMNKNNDVCHLNIDTTWGVKCEYGRQLLPGSSNQDGFYFALLKKC